MSGESHPLITTDFNTLLKCPICSSNFFLFDLKSIRCPNGHCYDLSKNGYLNFLTNSGKANYSKKLFESRRVINNSGFFQQLVQELSLAVSRHLPVNSAFVRILDCGCGEGSLLAAIYSKISKLTSCDIFAAGLDIAKESIILAARDFPRVFWCVADLSDCPFQNKQFNCIINVLAPCNYSELIRLSTDDGIILKVIPGRDYLRELRELFYLGSNKKIYSNDKTIALFNRNLRFVESRRLYYSKTLDRALIPHLIQMTPLTWGISQDKIETILRKDSLEVTVDLTIMAGKK